MLSEAVVERLRAHLERVRKLHEVDPAAGLPGGLVSGSPGTEMAGGCYRRLGMNPSVSPDSWARMAAMRWVTKSLSGMEGLPPQPVSLGTGRAGGLALPAQRAAHAASAA